MKQHRDCKLRVALEKDRHPGGQRKDKSGCAWSASVPGTRKRPHQHWRPQTLADLHLAGPENVTTEGPAGRATPSLGRPGRCLCSVLCAGSCCFITDTLNRWTATLTGTPNGPPH